MKGDFNEELADAQENKKTYIFESLLNTTQGIQVFMMIVKNILKIYLKKRS